MLLQDFLNMYVNLFGYSSSLTLAFGQFIYYVVFVAVVLLPFSIIFKVVRKWGVI